jgi:uncharacterized protein
MSVKERPNTAPNLVGFLAGSLFGLGLCVSVLTDPAVILGFLILPRRSQPHSPFRHGCRLDRTLIGYRLAFAPGHPQWSSQFGVPTATAIDTPLVSGALSFWHRLGTGGLLSGTGGGIACPRQRQGVISIATIAMIAVRLRRVRLPALPTGVRLNRSVASLPMGFAPSLTWAAASASGDRAGAGRTANCAG